MIQPTQPHGLPFLRRDFPSLMDSLLKRQKSTPFFPSSTFESPQKCLWENYWCFHLSPQKTTFNFKWTYFLPSEICTFLIVYYRIFPYVICRRKRYWFYDFSSNLIGKNLSTKSQRTPSQGIFDSKAYLCDIIFLIKNRGACDNFLLDMHVHVVIDDYVIYRVVTCCFPSKCL